MKPMKYRQLAKLLRSKGCVHVKTEGSHEKWQCPGGCVTSIPRDTEIAPGTLRNIRDNLKKCLGEGWLK